MSKQQQQLIIASPSASKDFRQFESYRKLRRLIGESVLPDVSLDEAELVGWPRILDSRLPLAYFLLYMLKEQCAENLVSTPPKNHKQ